MAESVKNKKDSKSNDWLTNSDMTMITIGDGIAEFRVHSSLLRTTSFFKVEYPTISPQSLPKDPGPATERAGKLLPQTGTNEGRPQQENDPDTSLFFSEHDSDIETLAENEVKLEGDRTIIGSSEELKKTEARYRFPNRGKFCPISFQIFLNYLYSKSVDVEVNDRSIKVILRSWILASRYECSTLQNELMDKVREYYTSNLVTLENLQWVARMTNTDSNCKLLAYLVEQIAFEELHNAEENSIGGNLHVESFWKTNDQPLRWPLFKAIVRVGRCTRYRDPSSASSKRWYV